MPFALGRRKFQFGLAKGRLATSGQLVPDLTAGSSLLAAETILNSVSLPAKSLYKNGCGLYISAFGSFAANGNTKRIKVYLGTQTLFDTGALTSNGTNWVISLQLVRLAVGSQITVVYYIDGTTPVAVALNATTVDETADSTIYVKGTAATANADILSKALIVEGLTI